MRRLGQYPARVCFSIIRSPPFALSPREGGPLRNFTIMTVPVVRSSSTVSGVIHDQIPVQWWPEARGQKWLSGNYGYITDFNQILYVARRVALLRALRRI
jgi:hypothetical protein